MIELFSADTPNGKKIGIMLEEIGWEYKVTKVNNFIATSWLTDPFSRGAYSYVEETNKEYDFDNLLEPISNKLFLCGEHTIFKYAGTTHGAYLTGQKAAQSIISIA